MVNGASNSGDRSMSAEMTPRVRSLGHPKWTKVPEQFGGRLIRVTGWLMLGAAHLPHLESLPDRHVHESTKL